MVYKLSGRGDHTIMKYINHYSIDYDKVSHLGKTLVETATSLSYQKYLSTMPSLPYNIGTVPPGYEHRPDLISDLFYNTVTLDWLILLFNGIDDPFENLNVGDTILIPKL